MCYLRHMRLHITLEAELVEELDRRAGKRQRSAYIAQLIRQALADERRWDEIEAALASIPDTGRAWDDDPARWVREQREADPARSG